MLRLAKDFAATKAIVCRFQKCHRRVGGVALAGVELARTQTSNFKMAMAPHMGTTLCGAIDKKSKSVVPCLYFTLIAL